MATGGKKKLSSSFSVKGSDFVIDFPCTPCSKDGTSEEGINYCVECSEYFCLACTKSHKRFGATSGHTVVDSSQAQTAGGGPSSTGPLPNEVCREHDGEKITTYCADHDLVLCSTCAAVDHRLCVGISYIPKVAGGSKQSQDVSNVKQDIAKTLKTVSQTKLTLQKSLTIADEEKKRYLQCARDYTERLIEHARDMEKTAVDDINSCHKTTTDKLQSGISSLDDTATTMKERLNNLENAKMNSDSHVFVNIKRGQYEVENAKELKQSLMHASTGKIMPGFVVKVDVDSFLNEVTCLGQCVEKKMYTATLCGEYDVGMPGEKNNCALSDSCELTDGTICFTDCALKCLMKVDKSYKVKECVRMTSSPFRICQIGQDEVAVTLTSEKEVQFVDARGKMKMTRSFRVKEPCRGICFSRDELFVACGGFKGNEYRAPEGPGYVGMYSISGSLLRKIQFDHHGQQILFWPRQVIASENGDKLYIADGDIGVVTVDRQGNVLSTFSEGIQQAYDICAITEGNLLVSGYGSNNVVQLDADGQMVAELLSEKDGVKEPMSLLFSKSSSRLILSENNSNKIKVLTLT